MNRTEVDLGRIAADIWAAILGIELAPAPALEQHDPRTRVVTGHVQITGAREAAVSVQVSERSALRAAAFMFGMEPDEVTAAEVADTVGELANMTGGNVKSLLEGACQLSLPSVTTGRDYQVSLPGSTVTQRATADCDGELVVVSMHERSA